MGQQFRWSAFLSVPPPASFKGDPQTHRDTHTCIYRDTHIHTQMDLYTLTHSHTCAYTLEHTLFWIHTHTWSLSQSLAVSHTPLVIVLDVRQSAVYTLALSLFTAAVPSLHSLFLSKQNEMKSNTDLIWLLQENLKYVLFQSAHFQSQISHLALTRRWNITCQVFLRHIFFQRNWKQLLCCWAINLAQGCTALWPSAQILRR